MSDRSPTQALAGRARGIVVGALIALGWVAYGASFASAAVRAFLLGIAVVATVALTTAGVMMVRRSRAMLAPTASQASAGRRTWRWFWLNFAAEIGLLNVAVNLLGAPDRRVYWIPAISAVVGLHFWPMAIFFRARSYWAVGAAMMLGAAIAAGLLAGNGAPAASVLPAEALGNAVVLWLALAAGAIAGLRRSASARLRASPVVRRDPDALTR